MKLTLIWIVVALAVLLVVADVAAVLRRVSVTEGTATLKLPGGVEIAGTGGAVILVLLGCLLLLTAWSWNDDRENPLRGREVPARGDPVSAGDRNHVRDLPRG